MSCTKITKPKTEIKLKENYVFKKEEKTNKNDENTIKLLTFEKIKCKNKKVSILLIKTIIVCQCY